MRSGEGHLPGSSLDGVVGSMLADSRAMSGLIVFRTAAVLLMTMGYSLTAVVAGFLTRTDNVPAKIMAHWGRMLLRLTGCRIVVECPTGLPDGGAVLVANHQSYLDIPMLQVALGARARFVAKRELGRIPLFGKSIVSAGTLLIGRKVTGEMVHWVREAVHCVRRGKLLVVFPEGTRSENGSIREFQQGAFFVARKCGVPVVPIYVDGGRKALPRGGRFIHPAKMVVNVLPLIPAGVLSCEEMAKTARERILSARTDGTETPWDRFQDPRAPPGGGQGEDRKTGSV